MPTHALRESTVAAALLIDLVRYMEQRGHHLGLDRSLLEQPNARVPGSEAERCWQLASQLAADPDIGLHAAENFNPGALSILGYVLLSCRSAREALARLAQFAALVNDGLRVRVTDSADRTQCGFEVIPHLNNYLDRTPRQAMETMTCGTLITMRRLTTLNVQPLAVAFRHPAPASTAEHLRIFGHCVRFGQPENFIEFRTSDLSANLLSANPALLAMFDAQAVQLLDQMGQRGPVSQRVLAILARRITVTVPALDEIAAELAMSERSLQRELRGENTSFRQLVEDMKREIACQHLARPGASASEAAFLLGFSEPSAFTRAFRRWTGSAPTQFQSA
jgi:AraC-like DNA-binding protein